MIIPSVEQQRQEPQQVTSPAAPVYALDAQSIEHLREMAAQAAADATEWATEAGRKRAEGDALYKEADVLLEQATRARSVATLRCALLRHARNGVVPEPSDEQMAITLVQAADPASPPVLDDREGQQMGEQARGPFTPTVPASPMTPNGSPVPAPPASLLYCTRCGDFLREETPREVAARQGSATPLDTSGECPNCAPRPPQGPPAAAAPQRSPYPSRSSRPSPSQGPAGHPGNDIADATPAAAHEAVWRGTHPGAEET